MSLPAGIRREVIHRANGQCSYCQSREEVVGASFTIDHVIPQALGGNDELDNLCLACWDCNRIKRAHVTAIDPLSGERVPLYHPNRQYWKEHFTWDGQGEVIVGTTAIGRATVERLQLNRSSLIRARKQWIRAGWHPPALAHEGD